MRMFRNLDKKSNQISFITQKFKETFGGPPTFIAAAPGRVNLIGEHTDYNDGYVFPVAIDKYINIAARKRPDRRVTLHALDVDDSWEFNLDTLDAIPPQAPAWSHYLIGVASLLQTSGREIAGIDAVITGNVPIGAGLSSSAALSVAATLAFLTAGSELETVESADNKKKTRGIVSTRRT